MDTSAKEKFGKSLSTKLLFHLVVVLADVLVEWRTEF